MNIRSAANMPERVQVVFSGDGRTRQSMAAECDINNIMSKFQKSGAITHFSRHAPRYDFADGIEFHEAMSIVAEGNSMFMDLPSELRARFSEPGDFLDFVQDEANADEMVVLGLRDPVTARETPSTEGRGARVEELPEAEEPPEAASEEA